MILSWLTFLDHPVICDNSPVKITVNAPSVWLNITVQPACNALYIVMCSWCWFCFLRVI